MISRKPTERRRKGDKTRENENGNNITPTIAEPHKKKGSLTLNSLQAVKRSLAKIIRFYNSGDLAADKYKNLIYGLSQLTYIYKVEFDIKSDERIKAIENALAELQGGRK